MKTKPTKTLLNEFPASSPAEWKAAAEALLKGAPFEKKLLTPTPEGITLQPIYTADASAGGGTPSFPGGADYRRGTHTLGHRAQAWEVAQALAAENPEALNRKLREALARGQSAIDLSCDCDDDGMDRASGNGSCLLDGLANFKTVFEGIPLASTPLYIRGTGKGLQTLALLEACLAENPSVDFSGFRGGLDIDPVAALAGTGTLPTSLDQLHEEMAVAARRCATKWPGLRAVGVSGMPYHRAGASVVEESAAMLATAVGYLRVLQMRGLSIDEAASQIRFTIPIGGNFFMELARLRAFRPLWARIVKAFGGTDAAAKAWIHARTGTYNKTRLDPHVNLLRTSTEALSAILGSVDSLRVDAFDAPNGLPSALAERVARNTQILLREECELTAVADPAGGSWFIEKLSDDLGATIWSTFQQIEKEGGILESLASGRLQSRLATTQAAREKAFAQRRSVLVGINQYPDTQETLPAKTDVAPAKPAAAPPETRAILNALALVAEAPPSDWLRALRMAFREGAGMSQVTRALRAKAAPPPRVEPLPGLRLAEPYEHLRESAGRYRANHGHRPKLFLVNIGPLRRHKARADFTCGFFEPGGFEVIYPEGFSSPADAARALADSGARAAVLCGHDEDYAAHAPDYLRALKAAIPSLHLILAGDPGGQAEAFKAAGMDAFISIRSNNYETNAALLKKLGAHGA